MMRQILALFAVLVFVFCAPASFAQNNPTTKDGEKSMPEKKDWEKQITDKQKAASDKTSDQATDKKAVEQKEAEQKDPANPEDIYEEYNDCTVEEAVDLLSKAPLGHLLLNGETPLSLPVSFLYENGRMYFSLRVEADKDALQLLEKKPRAFLCADRCEPDGWRSVHVFGSAKKIADEKQREELLKKYRAAFGDNGFTYDKDPKKIVLVEFTPEKMTGALMSVSSHYFAKLKEVGDKYEPKNPPPAKDAPSPFAKEVKVEGIDGALADFVLRQVQCGRVNTLGADFPYSSPLNYGYAGGKILFHSAKTSLKMQNIGKNKNISFDVDWFWDGSQWISVTVIGQARFLAPEEMILGMQTIAVFMNSPDGFIPKNFKPDPNHKIIGHSGRAVGAEGMSKRLTMVDLTPQKIIGRVLQIPKEWREKLPAETISPKK